jgi:hypothetical protein
MLKEQGWPALSLGDETEARWSVHSRPAGFFFGAGEQGDMAEDIESAIRQNAQGPESAEVDGVRMAIGAKRSNIKTQFLTEAMIISGLGGLLGSAAGIASAKAIAAASPFPALVQWSGVLLAISFSAMVGIFFGWYPARRAAALDPIEALRYE